MTNTKVHTTKFSAMAMGVIAMLFSVALFSSEAMAVSATYGSTRLKISGLLPECSYPQKSGGGKCLENLNAQSCLNTTPFSPIGRGVSSEMCARGKEWCAHNPGTKSRCPISSSKPVRNHAGYDYSAPCGTAIFAPCNGRITQCKTTGGSAGLYFLCDSDAVCGKKIEYRFYHNQECGRNGHYEKGKKIGAAGKVSGYPCHMHIEIRENGVLLDPMNSGFDDYVCGCTNKKVNRMNCFTGGAAPVTKAVDTGYEDVSGDLSAASAEGATDAAGENSEPDKDCVYDEVAENYRQAGCFFCKPFKILFNTASVMAKTAYDALAKSVSVIVVIAFAIWMAVTVLKFISSFEIKEPRILIKTLLNQAFRVLVIFLLLNGALSDILSMTLDPVFSTGLKIAQIGGTMTNGATPEACSGQGDLAVVGADVGGLSPAMGNGIICTIKRIQDQIIDILAIARISWCMAWEKASLLGLIPNFGYLITAILFFIAGFFFIMIYPFLLVDSILKMAIAIALFPAALGAFAFKITAQYLKKIWDVFINAILTFIFLSLIIMIISTIAQTYMAEIITDDVKNNQGAITWFALGAIKALFVLFLGWAVLGEAKEFSDKFSKSLSISDIGSTTGSSVNAFLKNRVAKPAAKGAWWATKKTGRFTHENMSHLARKGKRAFANSDFAKNNLAATDENGNALVDDNGDQMYNDYSVRGMWNRIRGRNVYRSYHKDANGNVSETRTTVNRSEMKTNDKGEIVEGKKKVSQSDAFGSVTTKVNEKGEMQVTSTDAKSTLRDLVDDSGEVDTEAMNAFLQNSLLPEKEKNILIMSQLIKNRMEGYDGGSLNGLPRSREVANGIDANGNKFIKIDQINSDGTKSTFTATFNGDNRVMTSIKTVGGDGKGVEYTTDGIIQRKTTIGQAKDGTVTLENRYSVSDYYSKRTPRPVYINGDVASILNRDNIMFSDEEMRRFGEQVRTEGNKAFSFSEFK